MKTIATLLVAALFALSLSVATGCAAVAPYLPTVIAAVTDGALVIDTIDKFVDRYFESRPNADLQKKVDIAVARTRSALDAALRIASGAQHLNQAKVDEAFAEFRLAYQDLLALTGPLGVMAGGGGKLQARPGGLLVPEPMALALRVGR
jgi:hypothetical protein